ncbi:MAG: hypothetical protein K2M09_08155, partial [Muribaculaceae bacterium]|nr:hypothetical protein [Muribaculaceae bacterium]
VPAAVSAGETIKFDGSVRTNTVQNIDNCHVTVMLINRTTGRIENAVSSSVSALPIEAPSIAPAENDAPVYDLLGRRVSNPQPGKIYIQGNKKIANY